MRKFRHILITVGLGWSALVSGAQWPQQDHAHSPVMFQAGGISLEQAVAMVQSKYGARVMKANTVEENGRVVHYIRLISADRSRVWTVRVDAATGREF